MVVMMMMVMMMMVVMMMMMMMMIPGCASEGFPPLLKLLGPGSLELRMQHGCR